MLEGAGENIYCIVDRESGSTIRSPEEETDQETLLPIRIIKKELARSVQDITNALPDSNISENASDAYAEDRADSRSEIEE